MKLRHTRKRVRRVTRILLRASTALLLACVVAVLGANLLAKKAGYGRLFDDAEKIAPGQVGLVFGCGHQFQGRENLYFRYRIDAATKLWQEGKLSCLIVSGDNATRYHNEPREMKKALVKNGVPAEKIVCDYAGFRTLDSVVRAKEVFGAQKLVFISQQFQNERAAYLAKAHGIEFTGYNAKDVKGAGARKTKFREVFARLKMWLDIHIFHTTPRHLGEKESLPR